MQTAILELDEHDFSFMQEQVSHGRYASADDVVRAALRLLEAQEGRFEHLRNALVQGENGGLSPRTVADIWSAVKGEQPRTDG